MHIFKDRNGDKWEINLTPEAIARVKERSEGRFDLSSPGSRVNGRAIWERLDDSGLEEFWELLWYIIEPQAMKRGVTAKEFGRLMASDVLLEARCSFFKCWQQMFESLGNWPYAGAVERIARLRVTNLKQARAELHRIQSRRKKV